MRPSPPLGAAARSIGLDYVPALLDRARRRADGRGCLSVEFIEGDAEALPFEDASFDVVPRSSAPCSRRTRITPRASWHASAGPAAASGSSRIRRTGSSATCSRSIARHVPPPAGLRSPIQWGTEERLARAVRRSDRRDPRPEAPHHLALSVAGGVCRVLAPLLRSDAQGVRGRRRGRPGCARGRPARPHRSLQPRR